MSLDVSAVQPAWHPYHMTIVTWKARSLFIRGCIAVHGDDCSFAQRQVPWPYSTPVVRDTTTTERSSREYEHHVVPTSSEAETRWGALAPRTRWKATRGCQNLKRGGTSPASSLTLERNGGSLESGWCGCLMGRGGRWAATGRGLSPCSMFQLLLIFVLREWFFVYVFIVRLLTNLFQK
jgi:hypothetical protein